MTSENRASIYETKPACVVVFDSTAPLDEPAPTFLPVIANAPDRRGTVPHLFDKELGPALYPIWFCIHLPRTFNDLRDAPASLIKRMQQFDLGHEIWLWPARLLVERRVLPMREGCAIRLVIAPQRHVDETRRVLAERAIDAEALVAETLDCRALSEQWARLTRLASERRRPLDRTLSLIENIDGGSSVLPMWWSQRQFLNWEIFPERHRVGELEHRRYWALEFQANIDALAKLESQGLSPEEAAPKVEAEIEASRHTMRIPVAVGLPGIPPLFARRILPAEERSRATLKAESEFAVPLDSLKLADLPDSTIERSVFEFVVAHRASARGRIGVMLDSVPMAAFDAVDRIEAHCQRGKENPKFIWKSLRGIASIFEPILPDYARSVIQRASMLTAFSNFPIGLVTVHGDTSPLSCRMPIAMRPVLPLTRTLQTELMNPDLVYLADSLRVGILECIPASDPVGRISRRGWDVSIETLKGTPNLTADRFEASSVTEAKSFIKDIRPHILIVSAHGFYDRDRNVAGIHVGNDMCFGDEFGDMPPCVLMSSCHTAPRGSGAACFGDALIRHGALCVINTMIPVNVFHNAELVVRFLSYISDCLSDQCELRDVAEIWHHVTCSNAVHDILRCCRPALEWGHGKLGNRTVLDVFKLERATGRIRRNHVYQDTIAILEELAAESGILERFRQWMRTLGFFPESLFYTMHGWPERIVVADENIKRMQRSTELSGRPRAVGE